MADKKFSQFLNGNEVQSGDQVVGLRSGTNYRFSLDQIISSEGVTWNNATSSTSFTAGVNNGYIINTAGSTTITLPATAGVGSIVAIQGSAQPWIVNPGAGQTIHVGSSSATVSVASTNNYDCIELICVVANTTWATRFVLSAGLTYA